MKYTQSLLFGVSSHATGIVSCQLEQLARFVMLTKYNPWSVYLHCFDFSPARVADYFLKEFFAVFYEQKMPGGVISPPGRLLGGESSHPERHRGGVPSPSEPSGGGCTYNLRAVSVGCRLMIMAMPIFKTL